MESGSTRDSRCLRDGERVCLGCRYEDSVGEDILYRLVDLEDGRMLRKRLVEIQVK